MPEIEELERLRSDVERLRNEVEGRQADPDAIAELRAALAALTDKYALSDRIAKLEQDNIRFVSADVVSDLRKDVAAATEWLKISERLAAIEKEHNKWKTVGTVVSVIISILSVVGVALGWIGYKSFNGVLQAAVDKRFVFYSDLSAGLAYADKYPTFAIPFLLRCFNQDPFQEPIVASLAFATDQGNDWDTGGTVLNRLRLYPTKTDSFRDATTYNLLGVAALNLGFSDSGYYNEAQRFFEQGLRIATPRQAYTLWYLHFNLWRLYLATGDMTKTNQELERLKSLPRPIDFESWESARKWKWFEELISRDKTLEKTAEHMYAIMFSSRG